MKLRVKAELLPSTCTVYPPGGTITSSGTLDDTALGTAITYAGSSAIPCRLDISNHFRTGHVYGQEVTLSEFVMHFPRDLALLANHIILFSSDYYEITKMMDDQEWDVTTFVLLSRVEVVSAR